MGAENGNSEGKTQEGPDRAAGARVGGADALRLFIISQKPPWDDLVFTWDGVVNAYRALNVFWNLHRFPLPYMAIDGFRPIDVAYEAIRAHLRVEDHWLLSRVRGMVEQVEHAMDNAELHVAARALVDFVVEDFSRWYVQLARRRTWVERDDPDKLAAYYTIWQALSTAVKVAAPFTPFIAEQMYQHVVVAADPATPPSVHMAEWPAARQEWRDERLEGQMAVLRRAVEAALHARHRAERGLRWPVARLAVVTADAGVADAVQSLSRVLLEQANAKTLETYAGMADLPDVGWEVSPVLGELGPAFKAKAPKVVAAVKALDPASVRASVAAGAPLKVKVDGEHIDVPPSMFTVSPALPAYLAAAEFEGGTVLVDTRLDDTLRAEGMVREVVRHAQDMRRELDLELGQRVELYVRAQGDVLKVLGAALEFIAEEVRARGVHLGEPGPEGSLAREVPLGEGGPVVLCMRVP